MQKILVKTTHFNYPVYAGDLKAIAHSGKVLVVSNPKVAGLYLDKVLSNIKAKEIFLCIVPDGEQYKNFTTLEQILEIAFSSRLDRKSLMIALGGGVISDMVGFASGIYQRGIEFVSIPTTLLAQVDASVGGKTGINNHFGKNLVGIFHQPKAVYVDPSFLASLPVREFSAGVAEMIKMAVCFDKEFFYWLKNHPLSEKKNLQEAILKSINIKAKVVEMDEKEQGIRAGLNYGHTFGHIIENLTNYSAFLHGEAVAIGMKMANALAFKLGYLKLEELNAINELLKTYSLDLDYEISDIQDFYQKFFLDKKSQNQKIKFILPKGIGDLLIIEDVPKDIVMAVLQAWGKN